VTFDAEGKKGSKGGEGSGDDTDAFFGEGPEAYFAGAVHEFAKVT